jgi:hypothetical protein
LNIKEYIDSLKTSAEAIGGAPEKGFLDLDMVKDTLLKTRQFLEQIAPQFELGLMLKQDFCSTLKSKIKTLRIAGCGQLLGQAERTLDAGQLDFGELKSLQKEIDQALSKNFGALKSPAGNSCPAHPNDYR